MSSPLEVAPGLRTLQGNAVDSDRHEDRHPPVLLAPLDQHSQAVCLAWLTVSDRFL
jgi:hypothetical protein